MAITRQFADSIQSDQQHRGSDRDAEQGTEAQADPARYLLLAGKAGLR
ncbi:hypothetical protein OG563_18935 [Nocardia vinacea]|uniref:Uncharacterized protein n=1 Tax=Nocardia vinacea TaxID=96468 RepID=A0ABZ1Z3E6_9NOCA|nr:hypothetical protein [Nocardia vinacea]